MSADNGAPAVPVNRLPVSQQPQPQVEITSSGGLAPKNMEQLWRLAVAVSKSGLAPKSVQSTEAIFTAMAMGLELGLQPMTALRSIAVVNGRPTMWGDAIMARCLQSPSCKGIDEVMEGKGDDLTAVCTVKREGFEPHVVRFSIADAKRAKLWGKQGPWSEYPERMLKYRARGFALRDRFADLLQGIVSHEEARDMPTDPQVVQAVVVPPQEPQQAAYEPGELPTEPELVRAGEAAVADGSMFGEEKTAYGN